jgi:hypothetical protein
MLLSKNKRLIFLFHCSNTLKESELIIINKERTKERRKRKKKEKKKKKKRKEKERKKIKD